MSAFERLGKRIERDGLVVAGLSPNAVVGNCDYEDLSNLADAIVKDIHMLFPEIFSSTSNTKLFPVELKMYLLAGMLDFLTRFATVINETGEVIPSTVGLEFPDAMFAYLQYLVTYTEGGASGQAVYDMTVNPTIQGGSGRGIVRNPGATTPGDIAQGQYDIPYYTKSGTYDEMEVSSSSATTIDIQAFMVSKARYCSALLGQLQYPTRPMPESWDLPAPDASYHGSPRQVGANYTQIANYSQWTCPFARWNPQISLCFYDDNLVYTGYNAVRSVVPSPFPDRFIGLADPGAATPVFSQTGFCQTMRENLVLLVRTSSPIKLGKRLEKQLSFEGERIKTLNIVRFPVNLYRYKLAAHYALAEIIRQNGYTAPTVGLIQAYEMVIAYAVAARLRLVMPSWDLVSTRASTSNCGRYPIPSAIRGQVRLPIPIAQLANEFGATVLDGQLMVPVIEAWGGHYMTIQARVVDTDIFILSNPILNTTAWQNPATGNITWGNSRTFSAPTTTNYMALSTTLYSPFLMVDRLVTIVNEYLNAGVGFGRGDVSYPVSMNPRGGLCMLVVTAFSRDSSQDFATNVIDFPNIASVSYYSAAFNALYSTISIGVDDVGLALLIGARRAFTEAVEPRLAKFAIRTPLSLTADTAIINYVSSGCSAGGVVVLTLAKAYEREHSGNIFVSGDDALVDTCLWDAVHASVSEVGRGLVRIMPSVAGAACNAMIPGSGQLCSGMAEMVRGRILDTTAVKTNRISVATPEIATAEVIHELKESEAKRELGKPLAISHQPTRREKKQAAQQVRRFDGKKPKGVSRQAKKKQAHRPKAPASKPGGKAKSKGGGNMKTRKSQ